MASRGYDAWTAPLERAWLGATRPWVCSRAHGAVLEVGVGTGANLPHYAALSSLVALDRSPRMLEAARERALACRFDVSLVQGDAMALPFPEAHFDAVVSTYALCGVADAGGALAELIRVLRPGGRLLLADHVVSTHRWIRVGQRALEALTAPAWGEHWTRRPLALLDGRGVTVVETQRRHAGVIELVHARKGGLS